MSPDSSLLNESSMLEEVVGELDLSLDEMPSYEDLEQQNSAFQIDVISLYNHCAEQGDALDAAASELASSRLTIAALQIDGGFKDEEIARLNAQIAQQAGETQQFVASAQALFAEATLSRDEQAAAHASEVAGLNCKYEVLLDVAAELLVALTALSDPIPGLP